MKKHKNSSNSNFFNNHKIELSEELLTKVCFISHGKNFAEASQNLRSNG